MGDPEGLVEWSVYGLVVGFTLPLVSRLESSSPTLATAFLLLAILPVPVWFVAIRFNTPDWVFRITVWNAWFVLALTAAGWLWLLGSWVLTLVVAGGFIGD